jgi:oxygen-independent coproporphyrinogen-3 oxidase
MTAYADRLGEFERTIDRIGLRESFEETLFLGLRLNEGVSLAALDRNFVAEIGDALRELEDAGLVERQGETIRLSDAGQMVSNEVFGRLLLEAEPA